MKKELLYFCIIFIVLSLGMHYKEFFSYPIVHIKNLQVAGAYGLGSLHPLVFTLFAYIILIIPRGIIKLLKKMPKKDN